MRPALTVTFAAAVLTLSACGSQSRVVTPLPRIPRSLATSLAARTDALAAALRRNDGCAAKIQMHGLERQTRTAVTSGWVPVAYRERLLAAVERLATRMPTCVPPPPPPTAPNPDAHSKKRDDHPKPKKHGKGHGD